jgi:hypothetical protein
MINDQKRKESRVRVEHIIYVEYMSYGAAFIIQNKVRGVAEKKEKRKEKG